MASNAMIIEFGVDRPMAETDMETFGQMLGTLNSWKAEDHIEDFDYYAVVTGNRTQRIGMMILNMSHDQLEAMVVADHWAKFMDLVMGTCTNVTVNRSITLERVMELMKANQ
jgi:hypothetical protein